MTLNVQEAWRTPRQQLWQTTNQHLKNWSIIIIIIIIISIIIFIIIIIIIIIITCIYQLLTHGRWFSPGTPASSTTKTGRHDIAEILLKGTLTRLVIGTSRTVGSAKKFVRITSGFGGGEFTLRELSSTKTGRYVHIKNWNFLFYCSNISKSENAMLWRMLSRLETCIVYSCIWSVTLAKSIVPRKTWRKLWHSYISKLFLTKMQVKFSLFFHHGSLNVIGDKFRFVRSKLKSR